MRLLVARGALLLLKFGYSKYCLSFVNLICGYKIAKIGTLTIVAPQEKLQIILDGVDYLKTLDPIMYQMLTVDQKYVCQYDKAISRAGEFFSINDNLLSYGKEGVVASFVQEILLFNRLHKPFERQPRRQTAAKLKAYNEILNQLCLWLKTNSFHPKLVAYYRKLLEKNG